MSGAKATDILCPPWVLNMCLPGSKVIYNFLHSGALNYCLPVSKASDNFQLLKLLNSYLSGSKAV